MNRLAQLIVTSQLVIFATPAFANPIAMEVVRAREVAGGHVQLTYGVDGKSPPTPSATVTFGSKSTSWKPLAGGYRTNTGSGVRGVNAIQMCDCEVAIGQTLSYKVTVASAYDGKPVTYTASLTTSGKYDPSPIAPPAEPDAGVMPWDIPDPIEVQGLDCAVECASTLPQGTGGATGAGGATETGGTTGTGAGGTTGTSTTDPVNQNGGGACSMVRSGGPASLFVLALGIGVAVLAMRKRRS